jgi:hypothetical protein
MEVWMEEDSEENRRDWRDQKDRRDQRDQKVRQEFHLHSMKFSLSSGSVYFPEF